MNFVNHDEKFGRRISTDPATGRKSVREGIRHVRITEIANPVWISHADGRHKKGYLPRQQ